MFTRIERGYFSMEKLKLKSLDKKGFSTTMSIISSIIALVFLVYFAFIFTSTLDDSSLLTDNSAGDNATDRLVGNFTEGVDEVSSRIPTVMIISVIVLIIAVLLILWGAMGRMGLTRGTVG